MATNTFNTTIAPPPLDDKFVDSEGFASDPFANWLLLDLLPRLQASTQSKQPTSLVNQGASIGVTALVPVPSQGDYRVNWYQQVTTVDSGAMSTTVSVESTSFTASIVQTGAAMNGNTLTTAQSGSFVVRADAGGVISFSVTAVLGVGDGRFAIDVIPEFLG
jgi:hypothetical protein